MSNLENENQEGMVNTGSEELGNEVSNMNQEEVNYTGLSDEDFLKLAEPIEEEGVIMSEDTSSYSGSEDGNVSGNLNQSNDGDKGDVSNAGSERVELSDEEFRRKISQGFNFNGRNVSINNPDDAIRLMQMGLNYKKKMENLNSNLGLVKTLQKNGISGEDLRFLIDLKNGDKGAIAQLLKDKEIDTYDLPDLEESPYIPNTQLVDNEQANFEEILDDIRSMNRGNELLNSLGSNTWDNESLRFFRNKPEALYLLYRDKSSGLYDEVLSQIELDDTLGKIPDNVKSKPFIELYEIVANQLESQRNNSNVGSGISLNQEMNQSNRRVIGNNVVGVNPQSYSGSNRNTNAPRSANVNTGSVGSGVVNQGVPNFLMMTDKQFEEYEEKLNSLNFY